MDDRVITYRVGMESSPTAMLLALADMHGIKAEVSKLVDDAPDEDMPDGSEELGNLLRRHRQAYNLKRKDVQSRSNISRSQLLFYESGQVKNPGLRTVQALAYGYKLPFIRVLLAALTEISPRMNVRKRNRD